MKSGKFEGGMNDFLKMLKGLAGEDLDKSKIIKTVPATKEWKKMWQEYSELFEQAQLLDKKADSVRRLFWSTVEKDMDDYTHTHSYNEDTDEVEVYENQFDKAKAKGKSVKSPIQIKL